MSNAPDEFINVIKDLVQQELSKRGGVVLCQIKEKKDETHYDLVLESDRDNYIHNVTNMTKFDLSVGDYVYIFKINGQLNNAFICYKVIPYIENASVSGNTEVERIYSISFQVNKNKYNKNVPIQYLINEVNDNSANKKFLLNSTSFSQARPYYVSFYRPYWMFGKRNDTVNEIGFFSMELEETKTFNGTFTITNGFTINNLTQKVASNVSSHAVTVKCYGLNDELIMEATQTLASLSAGTSLSNVPRYTITLPENILKQVKTIKFFTSVPGSRFNMFEMGLQYKM